MELIAHNLITGQTLQIPLSEDQYNLLEGKDWGDIARLLLGNPNQHRYVESGRLVAYSRPLDVLPLFQLREMINKEWGDVHFMDTIMFIASPTLKRLARGLDDTGAMKILNAVFPERLIK